MSDPEPMLALCVHILVVMVWRGVIGALVSISLAVIVVGSLPSSVATTAPTVAVPTPKPFAPAPTPAPSDIFHSAPGFDLRLPAGWLASDREEVINRRSYRLLVVGNGGTDVGPTVSGNPDWTTVPGDRIRLELMLFAGPGGGAFEGESRFPLDWSAARALPDQGDFAVRALTFQHLLRPLTLTAHIGRSAPASLQDDLAKLVASLRPEAIPAQGEYRGWQVMGPLDAFPVGTVRHFDAVGGAYGFFLVRGAQNVFAFIDHAYLFMAAIKPCPLRYESYSRTFVCDSTGDRWSRVGKQLSTETSWFGLPYHSAFVKDGLILVGGSSGSSSRNTYDETLEFADPVSPPIRGNDRVSRGEIIDRYSRLTSTAVVLRAEARLVPFDGLARSGFVRGALTPPSYSAPIWVVAFSGEVRPQGFTEVFGGWTVFLADANTGGMITAACCEGGTDWPAGFDTLPDIAN
jgi:hypothetical protein